MSQTINTKGIGIALAFLLFFSVGIQAFAYDNLKIEIEFEDGAAKVDVKYDEDGTEVERDFTFATDDIDEVYVNVADELDLSVDAVKDAVVEIESSDDEEDTSEVVNDTEAEEDSSEVVDDTEAEEYLDDAAEEVVEAEEDIAEAEDKGKVTDVARTALTDARELLKEARAAFAAGEYAKARALAKEAKKLAARAHMKYLGKHADEISDFRPKACDKNVPGRALGLRKLCDGKHDKLDRHVAKCRLDMLRDGERDRKFCRNGEWVEKREARLDDLLAGAIDAADLTDEQAEIIRDEMIALIRQLITRLFQTRLGA